MQVKQLTQDNKRLNNALQELTEVKHNLDVKCDKLTNSLAACESRCNELEKQVQHLVSVNSDLTAQLNDTST